MTDIRIERCEYCQDGWAEGHPSPGPDGPIYPYTRCTACDGHGNATVEFRPITQDDIDAIADGDTLGGA